MIWYSNADHKNYSKRALITEPKLKAASPWRLWETFARSLEHSFTMLKCMPSIAQLLRAQRLTLGQACSALQSSNFASSSSDEDNHPGSSFSHVHWTRLELKHSLIDLFIHADRIHWQFTPRLSQTSILDQPGMVVCMYSECLYIGTACSLDSCVHGTVLMAPDTTTPHGSRHESGIFI